MVMGKTVEVVEKDLRGRAGDRAGESRSRACEGGREGQSTQGDYCHSPSEKEHNHGRVKNGSNYHILGDAEAMKPSRGQR